jgi:hypothetical protein
MRWGLERLACVQNLWHRPRLATPDRRALARGLSRGACDDCGA